MWDCEMTCLICNEKMIVGNLIESKIVPITSDLEKVVGYYKPQCPKCGYLFLFQMEQFKKK